MKRTGKKIKPKDDLAVKAIWDRDQGEVYLQSDGSKIVYYPDGSCCKYPTKN